MIRWLDAPLDWDYCPYAYPAIFKTPYLKDGSLDIKPPLIHWSYKLWLSIVSSLNLKLETCLRLPVLLSILVSIAVAWRTNNVSSAMVMACLLLSPSLWPHMANTEWMTGLLWMLSLSTGSVWPLGLTLLVNQKNLLLLAPVIWAMDIHLAPTDLIALLLPAALVGLWLSLTGRAKRAWFCLVTMPYRMGKSRTFKNNVLQGLYTFKYSIFLIAPFAATMQGRWAWVALAVVLVMIWSKQVTPHHFILLAFPVALASRPEVSTWISWALVWACRDLIVWLRPSSLYAVTFGYGEKLNYGLFLKDGNPVEAWIRDHTTADERIWVNGVDNQIYLGAMRKAWQINVPEWQDLPEGTPPRVIVHCKDTALKFDYDAYKPVFVSPQGRYTVMEKS